MTLSITAFKYILNSSFLLSKTKRWTDTCNKCVQYFYTKVHTAEEREEYLNHIAAAKSERDWHKSIRERLLTDPEFASYTLHLIVDFAGNFEIPSSFYETNIETFLRKFNCIWFGINEFPGNKHSAYLSHRSVQAKGSNGAFTALLHKILSVPQAQRRRLILESDNGKDFKSRHFLYFCYCLVLSGICETVEIHYFFPVHGKNVCDGSFGSVKSKYHQKPVYTIPAVGGLIQSSLSGVNTSFLGHCFDFKTALDDLFGTKSLANFNSYLYHEIQRDSVTNQVTIRSKKSAMHTEFVLSTTYPVNPAADGNFLTLVRPKKIPYKAATPAQLKDWSKLGHPFPPAFSACFKDLVEPTETDGGRTMESFFSCISEEDCDGSSTPSDVRHAVAGLEKAKKMHNAGLKLPCLFLNGSYDDFIG